MNPHSDFSSDQLAYVSKRFQDWALSLKAFWSRDLFLTHLKSY